MGINRHRRPSQRSVDDYVAMYAAQIARGVVPLDKFLAKVPVRFREQVRRRLPNEEAPVDGRS